MAVMINFVFVAIVLVLFFYFLPRINKKYRTYLNALVKSNIIDTYKSKGENVLNIIEAKKDSSLPFDTNEFIYSSNIASMFNREYFFKVILEVQGKKVQKWVHTQYFFNKELFFIEKT